MEKDNSILVQLIGISGDVRYEQLRQNILAALPYVPCTFSLQEINEVNEIVQQKLSAIPAVLINEFFYIEAVNVIPSTSEIIIFLTQASQKDRA